MFCFDKKDQHKKEVFCFLDRAFSMMKKRINQQNAQINFWINLLLFNHSNIFRPPSRSHRQGVQNPWELQSHCDDLLECCYVYVFTSRCDCCGMLSIPQQWLRLGGRNMLEWLNNNKLIQKLICAFCWFILFFNKKEVFQTKCNIFEFQIWYMMNFVNPRVI